VRVQAHAFAVRLRRGGGAVPLLVAVRLVHGQTEIVLRFARTALNPQQLLAGQYVLRIKGGRLHDRSGRSLADFQTALAPLLL
jgi:hypothetical protein